MEIPPSLPIKVTLFNRSCFIFGNETSSFKRRKTINWTSFFPSSLGSLYFARHTCRKEEDGRWRSWFRVVVRPAGMMRNIEFDESLRENTWHNGERQCLCARAKSPLLRAQTSCRTKTHFEMKEKRVFRKNRILLKKQNAYDSNCVVRVVVCVRISRVFLCFSWTPQEITYELWRSSFEKPIMRDRSDQIRLARKRVINARRHTRIRLDIEPDSSVSPRRGAKKNSNFEHCKRFRSVNASRRWANKQHSLGEATKCV